LKQKDLQILVELRKNARAQLTEISKKTHIPISTIYDRLKNKSNGAIFKHVSLLNFELLGFTTKANICIKCGKNSKEDIYKLLLKHQNVNSFYKINNGFDYMVETIFKNIKELEEFLEVLEDRFTIKTKQVYYIIDEISKEKFFSDQIYLEILKIPKNTPKKQTFIYNQYN